ncbi:hypothetical protein PV328_011066 [Microctonus aethiopoides]|uniref:Uncharacterized protein n=1 Tax=Microctonus aethiopoides TaxID=144406 RepID=A0AA39C3R3_9HYME|nr:hypothetical protein PV328_011066 [Microctonus aethiopoides]
MANRNHKETEDILKQIVRTSDIIRRKLKMIKLGRDKTEQAMKEVFKPVMTPLEKLVTTSNQMKREIKDKPTDIISKEEIDQTYATAISENYDRVEIDHTFNNSELNKTINQFESDDIPFESSPLKKHESVVNTKSSQRFMSATYLSSKLLPNSYTTIENNSTLYLKKLFSNKKGMDTRFGVRKLKDR